MNRSILTTLSVSVLICIALASCVTKGKYLVAESQMHQLESDSTNTHHQLTACNSKVKDLEDAKAALESEKNSVYNDLQSLSSQSKNAAAQSKMTIAEQAKRLKDLQDLLQSQRNAMNKLRKTIADALVNFKSDELSVYIKDGNVYVSLQEKLLFKSGSAVVDPKGISALGTLAQVLNSTPDVNVDIVGHTDTVPIRRPNFQDNWALSVGRSTAIVRILTADGFDPHRITASGRAEFHPVAPNDTDAGRASNRRTEIILSPNLTELYTLLSK
jgi:chemotaxis protein MotB